MKQEQYLNLKTSWQSIWETIRTWVLNNKGTGFTSLPQCRPSESRTWAAHGERLKVIPSERELTVSYIKIRDGITWNTEIYFKRAKRSIYTRVTVEPKGAAEPVEIKMPRIVALLKKRFGDMSESPKKRKSHEDGGERVANVLPKVIVAGYTPELEKMMHEAEKSKGGGKAKRRVSKGGFRAKDGELTQEDVAKDLGVTRQTVIKWEDEQTEDGPGNTSNPYHYYRSLRLNPNLRDAYTTLVNSVKAYLEAKAKAKAKGVRFRVAFERFNEKFLKHNQK